MKKTLCPYGTHRVLAPSDALPQNAEKVDNSLPLYDNELLIDVDVLNIDAASFHQMSEASHGNQEGIKEIILKTVEERGKQHNPVTGSGGMLLGTVKEIGKSYSNRHQVRVGDRIATLVSLSLTPLKISEIKKIYAERDQVLVAGHAVLFETGILAKIPHDLPERLALAVLDVAGAPAQTKRLVKPHQNVVIVGAGGKSGSLCAAMAREILGDTGKLIGIEPSSKGVERMRALGYFDAIVECDARKPVHCMKAVADATVGQMADVVINCVTVENTELSSIMSAKPTQQAIVYFFSMATSFTKVALGAEGVASDATLIIGNGYAPHHAEIALDTMRKHAKLRAIFERMYASE